jgi:hypothetical protein
MNTAVPRPVIIDWDEGRGQYRIDPLLSERLRFDPNIAPGEYGSGARASYESTALYDPAAKVTVANAHGAETFAIRRGNPPLLLAVFLISASCHACTPVMELQGWKLDFEAPTPQVGHCVPLNGRPILFSPTTFEALKPEALESLWTTQQESGQSHTTHNLISCA